MTRCLLVLFFLIINVFVLRMCRLNMDFLSKQRMKYLFSYFRCTRLGCVSLAYLWRRNQTELLQDMIDCGIHAIIIKTASLGLDPSIHLGQTLKQIQPHLLKSVSGCSRERLRFIMNTLLNPRKPSIP